MHLNKIIIKYHKNYHHQVIEYQKNLKVLINRYFQKLHQVVNYQEYL